MKLLLENWRKYLAESEEKYFPWLKDLPEFIQSLAGWRGADPENPHFKKLGTGSFRSVWAPTGDDEHVVKIVHRPRVGRPDKENLQMNKDDFETSKRYPLIFPKAYAHADDFSWVVMEKATPVSRMEDMQKILDKSFPAEQEAILQSRQAKNINPADPFHIMKVIMSSFRGGDRAKMPRAGYESEEDLEAPRVQDLLVPVAGPPYQELSKAMHEFAIDKYEIGRGNIGHDNEGNFKIIDSSVFDPDWDGSDVHIKIS